MSEDERVVLEAVRSIAAAFDRRDADALLSAHDQSPASSMIPSGGKRVEGWEAVRAQLEASMNEFQYSRTDIADPRVSIRGDVAVVTYRQRIDSRIHDIDFRWMGWVTDVLVRKDGKWLRRHHHASDAE